jgi:hypothetical protein
MKREKMNEYSLIRVGSVLVLTVMLVLSAFTWGTAANGSANTPPYEPSNPDPANSSMNVSVTADLSWTGGDPDPGDTVTYDVYFGATSTPLKVVSNQSATTYDPGVMNYSTHYYWKIIAWDNNGASTSGLRWEFITGPKPNTPPNTPSNPNPENESTGIIIDAILSWTGGDPDNDTVTYDVYFGTTSNPGKVASNHSGTSYNPAGSLAYNTAYYWRIIAWDNQSASAVGPLWVFTTKHEEMISVIITKPLEKSFYFQDEKRFSLPQRTIIYGSITITANATADAEVALVEFYIDGKLIANDTTAPYNYTWSPIIQFNGLSLQHTIKVIAYDTNGKNATAELNVSKWRFHVLPFAVGAAAVASTLIPHTTIRGFVFNVKETGLGLSFFALRIHYKTVGPLKSVKGVLHLKNCRVGMLLGPISTFKFGLFRSFAWISLTCLGPIHFPQGGSQQGLLQ